jgi:hypothetical protein
MGILVLIIILKYYMMLPELNVICSSHFQLLTEPVGAAVTLLARIPETLRSNLRRDTCVP